MWLSEIDDKRKRIAKNLLKRKLTLVLFDFQRRTVDVRTLIECASPPYEWRCQHCVCSNSLPLEWKTILSSNQKRWVDMLARWARYRCMRACVCVRESVYKMFSTNNIVASVWIVCASIMSMCWWVWVKNNFVIDIRTIY